MSRLQKFAAVIKAAGKHSYVELLPIVVESLGAGEKIPVMVKIEKLQAGRRKGTAKPNRRNFAKDAEPLIAIARLTPEGWFRKTLIPTKTGGLRLLVDVWMRDAAGVGVRDKVRMTLKPDLAPRVVQIPDALREALDEDAKARAAWEALPPLRQREILAYLHFLRRPGALEISVRKMIASLLENPWGGQLDPPHPFRAG